jgi:hypothetical protein
MGIGLGLSSYLVSLPDGEEEGGEEEQEREDR